MTLSFRVLCPFAMLVIAALAPRLALGVIQSAELGYSAFYLQTGPLSVPTLSHHAFHARLITNDDEDLFFADVRPSSPLNAPTRSLEDLDGGFTYMFTSADYASESAMRTDFPNATYTFSISGGTLGVLTSPVAGPATLLWPTVIPRFFSVTYSALSNYNTYQPFTFTFNANNSTLPFGATSIATTFTIADTTGFVVYSAQVANTATSHTVPANTLLPDGAYAATITYTVLATANNAAFTTAQRIHTFSRSTSADIFTGPVCTADFDFSGTLTPQDIFDYLNAWFAGSASADMDGLPGLSPQDIFVFLNLWFVGQC